MAENRLACTPKLMALCCVPEMQCVGWEGLGCWRVPAREGLLAQSWRGHRWGGGVPRLGGVGGPCPAPCCLYSQRDLDLSPGQGHGHVAP